MQIYRGICAGRVVFGTNYDGQSFEELEGELIDPSAGKPHALKSTGRRVKIDQLLSPIVPTDILCIGLNYRKHAEESKMAIPQHPMLFIKSGNALNHPGSPIAIPRLSKLIDYEGELAIVMGRDAKYVSRDRVMDYVLGYTIANDVSARDWQRDKNLGGGQFARGKSFDGFCPVGPCIVTPDEVGDPNALQLTTRVNGQVMQSETTADMIFDVPTLIASLSSTMTVRAGSVILTGTPSGVGFARTPPVWLKKGDVVEVEIEKIGVLKNPVVDEV